MNTTTAIVSPATLRAMTNTELDDLLDNLVEGLVEVANPLKVYDDALTERYRVGRADRVAVLPLEAEAAPDTVACFLF